MSGCASNTNESTGDETHFQTCKVDSDCTSPGTTCDIGKCRTPSEIATRACAAAGGTCLIGPASAGCTRIETVDCNPGRNPGGAVCCANTDAGDSEDGSLSPEEQCAAAGGTCRIGSVELDGTCAVIDSVDCNPDRNPGGAVCCANTDASGPEAGAASATSCEVENPVPILASDYDQSCQTDSDCVNVGVGSGCYVCELVCPLAAINTEEKAKYDADLASNPLSSQVASALCGCPAASWPCCLNGTCSASVECSMP